MSKMSAIGKGLKFIAKGIGAISKEIIQESTGIDIAKTKELYSKFDKAYKTLIENESTLVSIHGQEWFNTRKSTLQQAAVRALKGELSSVQHEKYANAEVYITGKLDELSDEELIAVSKRDTNKNNPKIYKLIVNEMHSRGL